MARFEKGQSGNPSGRPKQTQAELDFIRSCREKVPAALDKLMVLLDSESESVALRAAQILIERAYGRPRQEIDMTTYQDDMPKPPEIHITFIDNDGKPVTASMDEYRKRSLAEKEMAGVNA